MLASERMKTNSQNNPCRECGEVVESLPTALEFEGQEIFLFDPVVCKPCLLRLCQNHSTPCGNCGGTIPPYSQVGVHRGEDGQNQYVHMTGACSTVGSAFHGYWGKGKIHPFVEIEAC